MQLLPAIRSIPSRIVRSRHCQSQIRLPRELDSVADIHVGDEYRHIADKHAATIGSYFDNGKNCRSTNRGVRKELVDRSFISGDIAEIAARRTRGSCDWSSSRINAGRFSPPVPPNPR